MMNVSALVSPTRVLPINGRNQKGEKTMTLELLKLLIIILVVSVCALSACLGYQVGRATEAYSSVIREAKITKKEREQCQGQKNIENRK